jgi:hypothetical protein
MKKILAEELTPGMKIVNHDGFYGPHPYKVCKTPVSVANGAYVLVEIAVKYANGKKDVTIMQYKPSDSITIK